MEVDQINNKNTTTTTLEAAYEKHSEKIPHIKQEYDDVYKELVNCLKEKQLDVFAKILLDKESIAISSKDLIKSLQDKLLQQLRHSTEMFWQECDVAHNLISLEMLKDKFKAYEGHDWGILNKTPEQRCQHLRMHFKQARIRCLKKQINCQTKELEYVLEENKKHRKRIQDINKSRTMCRRMLEDFLKASDENKFQLKQMQEELWNLVDNV